MEVSNTFMVLVPVVVALVEGIKRVGLNARYCGILAILLGIGGAAITAGVFSTAIILPGLIVGLTASGLYSAGRSTLNV